jgi:hypothetical protein
VKLAAKEGLRGKDSGDPGAGKGRDYKEDPLIQEALEMFKGQIKS